MNRVCELTFNERAKVFAERLHSKDNTKVYHSGYIDIDSRCNIRCLKCNAIYSITATIIRNKAKYIRCLNCERIARDNKKQERKALLLKNKEHKKELTRIKNSLKYKQIEFNICVGCGKLFIGNTMYCSQRCSKKQEDRRKEHRRRIRTKSNGSFDNDITLDKLINRDNNICYLCGKECNTNDYEVINNTFIAGNYYPSIEHIIPLAKGGTHTWENIKLAHRICNTLKRDKILE